MSRHGNPTRRRWERWRIRGLSAALALMLIAVAVIGLAPRAAAHRQVASSQTKLPPVILPTYYDGIETQTVDQSVHPTDPPNTYRVDTHYSLCQQFGGPSDPSQRVNLTDAELAQDGLMPRNAFANIADWDRSILNATVRSCDTFTIYNDADGSPAIVNGSPSTPRAGPWSPRQPKDGQTYTDCHCTNYEPTYEGSGAGYAGFADDGSWTSTSNGPTSTQHVAQYGYSWVPTLASNGGTNPIYARDSIWAGGSGLFTHNNVKEGLEQTGIEDTYLCLPGNPCGQVDKLFWECTDPAHNNPSPCNGAREWDGTELPSPDPVVPGDEITMYTSGNYHWNEDDRTGEINASNNGPQPALDSSEWIVEDPDCGGCSWVQPLANYGHVGIADMQWLDMFNNWNDTIYDTDYIWYDAHGTTASYNLEALSYGYPQYINSTWNYGISVWWQHTS